MTTKAANPRAALITLPNQDTEPMTTDIAVDLFDFGEMLEDELEAIAQSMQIGETRDVTCVIGDSYKWTMTVRREG